MIGRVARTIKHHRKRLGMTQEQLAAHCGVSLKEVKKWESYRAVPKQSDTNTMIHLFEISIDEMTGGRQRLYEFWGYMNGIVITLIGLSFIIFFSLSSVGIFMSNNDFKIYEYPIEVGAFLNGEEIVDSISTLSVERNLLKSDYKIDVTNKSQYGEAEFDVLFDAKHLDKINSSLTIYPKDIIVENHSEYEVDVRSVVIGYFEGNVTVRVYYSIYYNLDNLFEFIEHQEAILVTGEMLAEDLIDYKG